MRDGISTWAETNPCRERPIRYNRRMLERPRVVVVTGSGGSGCGRTIAARFARDKAAVVVSDIDEAGGHATVRLIEQRGGRAAFFRADVGDELQAQRLIEFAAGSDRIGWAKAVLGVAHTSPARGAWGSLEAAVDRGHRRDGRRFGHGRFHEWPSRCVVVRGSAAIDSVGRSRLP